MPSPSAFLRSRGQWHTRRLRVPFPAYPDICSPAPTCLVGLAVFLARLQQSLPRSCRQSGIPFRLIFTILERLDALVVSQCDFDEIAPWRPVAPPALFVGLPARRQRP